MATDLAEILTDLRTAADTARRDDPAAVADARAALTRLRPALERLRVDGLDTRKTDAGSGAADADAFAREADRVHWVRLLEGACRRLDGSRAQHNPPDTPGRMTRLADAAAVTATLHTDVLTNGQRWAITAALARTAHHLTAAASSPDDPAEVARALVIADSSASVLFQFATLDPPTVADTTVLRWPVPNPTAEPMTFEDRMLEATAGLVHTTRPGSGPHSIADILAVTIAAETTCTWLAAEHRRRSEDAGADRAANAAIAWADVRSELRPFNDGSRRAQSAPPPAVAHALEIHRLLHPSSAAAGAQVPRAVDGGVLRAAEGRLSAAAAHVDASIVEGAARGRFAAYARGLPPRDERARATRRPHRPRPRHRRCTRRPSGGSRVVGRGAGWDGPGGSRTGRARRRLCHTTMRTCVAVADREDVAY